MALTPEDVVNKRFQPTKFREGYDQDEVDDFLDEVVVEMRRLVQENEELKQRLAASDSRISELQRSGGQAVAAPEPTVSEPETPEEQAEAAPAPAVVPAPIAAVDAVEGTEAAEGTDAAEAESTNSLLQLARRLHEEHVREGLEKRDALIAEGNATAARVVAEAEDTQRTQLAALEKERTRLNQEIDGLRVFEREYRQKLRSYIEGQLHDLDASSSGVTGSDAPDTGSRGAASPATGEHAAADEGDSDESDSTGRPAFPGFAG